MLVGARAVQGIGGAVVAAVALSLIMTLFTEPAERAKAMGVIGFVAAGGGSIGVLAGGVLTDLLSWHWIFLVNLPIGIGVIVCCLILLPAGGARPAGARLDVGGALLVTGSLILAVYAIVNGNEQGWTSGRTLGLLGAAVAGLVAFLVLETRVAEPLMPLGLFRLRSVAVCEHGRDPLVGRDVRDVLPRGALPPARARLRAARGRARLPAREPPDGGVLARPLGADRDALRRQAARSSIGMAFVAVGLGLFARAPVDASFVVDVLPGMLILGVGIGLAMNPLLLAAMSDVRQEDTGLASGVVNTSFMLGGALGLAVLASVAAARTGEAHTSAGLVERLPRRVPDRHALRGGRGRRRRGLPPGSPRRPRRAWRAPRALEAA